MRFLVVLYALALIGGAAAVCFPFQSFSSPKNVRIERVQLLEAHNCLCICQTPELVRCGVYSQSTCCSDSAAKRAYNWIREDDGCGIVYGPCRKLLTDLSCAQSCSPNNIVTGYNYRFP